MLYMIYKTVFRYLRQKNPIKWNSSELKRNFEGFR